MLKHSVLNIRKKD